MARGKYEEWLQKDNLTRVESWASDGLTNEQIAHNMGIAIRTLNTWLSKYEPIKRAIKIGREPVVREIENALIKSAKGFEYEEQTIVMWVDEEGNKRQQVTKHKKYSKPDTAAGIFLLKNYKPNKYRNYNELTKKQIEQEMLKLEAETNKLIAEAEKMKLETDTLSATVNVVIEEGWAEDESDSEIQGAE